MKRNLAIALLALAPIVDLGAAGIAPSSNIPAPADVTGIPVYLAVDLSSHQVLAQREADRVFLPASMTKVMTAYVAFELIAQGKLKPEQTITVEPQTAAIWRTRGTGMRLKGGEQVTVDLLLRGIATVSANDASVILAEGVTGSVEGWLALMNAEARKLGMTASHFGTPNGWPDGGKTHVSANDLVKLGQALVERHPELYRRYFGQKTLTWNGGTGRNHDPIIGVVPGADGIKTGHTNEAGYNFLGTAVRNGRRIMIVVGGARSEAQRAEASRALLEWSFSAWDTKPLFARSAVVGRALVQNGDAREMPLIAPNGASLAIPSGAEPQVTMTLHYRGPIVAPIAKGARVAELEVAVPGQPRAHFPLIAGTSIARAGPFDRLVNGLAGLLP